MNATAQLSTANPIQLPGRDCPNCGMPEAAALATLPSGRRALIEACAICGRQEAAPVSAEQACALLAGNGTEAAANRAL